MPHSTRSFWFVNTNVPTNKSQYQSWVRDSETREIATLSLKHGETTQHQLWWQVKGKREGKKIQTILRKLNRGKRMRVYCQLWDGVPF